jgi:hypothetical protein
MVRKEELITCKATTSVYQYTITEQQAIWQHAQPILQSIPALHPKLSVKVGWLGLHRLGPIPAS